MGLNCTYVKILEVGNMTTAKNGLAKYTYYVSNVHVTLQIAHVDSCIH